MAASSSLESGSFPVSIAAYQTQKELYEKALDEITVFRTQLDRRVSLFQNQRIAKLPPVRDLKTEAREYVGKFELFKQTLEQAKLFKGKFEKLVEVQKPSDSSDASRVSNYQEVSDCYGQIVTLVSKMEQLLFGKGYLEAGTDYHLEKFCLIALNNGQPLDLSTRAVAFMWPKPVIPDLDGPFPTNRVAAAVSALWSWVPSVNISVSTGPASYTQVQPPYDPNQSFDFETDGDFDEFKEKKEAGPSGASATSSEPLSGLSPNTSSPAALTVAAPAQSSASALVSSPLPASASSDSLAVQSSSALSSPLSGSLSASVSATTTDTVAEEAAAGTSSELETDAAPTSPSRAPPAARGGKKNQRGGRGRRRGSAHK